MPIDAAVPPLAAVALAQHRGSPIASYQGGQLHIGDQAWPARGDTHVFMPYLIPFFDWDKRPAWSGVAGRTVFLGACRLDRDLTRFGRQPGVVAHGEMFETLRDGADPVDASAATDGFLALVTTGLAAASRRWHVRAGPALVGVAVVLLVAWAQLHGLWLGLSGVVVGAGIQAFRRGA